MLIAGVVWQIAGFNVIRLGVLSYLAIDRMWYLYLLSIVIFCLFGLMFYKMSDKHTNRILNYEDDRPFWHFFDFKSYLIMIFMMSGGIGLRASGLVPDTFIAFFILGLAVLWPWQELYLSRIILPIRVSLKNKTFVRKTLTKNIHSDILQL